MPDPFKTQLALVKAENCARVSDIAERLTALLDELDAIGTMLASAHLSMAIESLKSSIADPASASDSCPAFKINT